MILPRIAASALMCCLAGGTHIASASRAQQRGQRRPVFRAAVDRVRVDVIVTDGDGRFLDDLRADDFRVFEDGAEQAILDLQLVDLASGQVFDLGADPENMRGDPGEAGDLSAAPERTRYAPDFGAIVYLIDFTGLDDRSKRRFAEQWNEILDRTSVLQVPQAVYLFDSVGRLHELAPLTRDIDSLLSSPGRLAETGLTTPTAGFAEVGGIFGGEGAPGAGLGGAAAGDEIAAEADTGGADARQQEFTERNRSLDTYKRLSQFADALSARDGRTALVWVSSGVTLGGFRPNLGVLDRQERFHQAANTANVSVYAVDPRTLADLVGGGVNLSVQAAPALNSAGPRRAGSALDELGNSLRHAAAETGGRHFIAWAEMSDVMERIADDTGRYYLLTYAAPPPSGDGEYHEIRVEVDAPGARVRARRGYVDYPAGERRGRRIGAALALPGTVAGLSVEAATELRRRADPDAAVRTTVSVDAADLGLLTDSQGARVTDASVHGQVLDEGGDPVDAWSGRLRVRAPPDVMAGSPWRGALTYRHEWRLPPGRWDVRVAVYDEVSGRIGATRAWLVVPE